MTTETKTSIENMINNIDSSYKAYKSNLSNKTTSELYKTCGNETTSKREDFKKVLSSKTNHKDEEDNHKIDAVNENQASNEDTKSAKVNDNTDEVKEKLHDLEEESKSDSKDKTEDKTKDVLEELLALLAKLGIKEEDLKVDGKINSDILNNIINGINKDKSSNDNLNSIMEKIMELLKNDSVKSGLDTDSLKTIEKLLTNLSSNLADDKTEASKDVKNGIKNLMSEINNMLNNKQDETKKVLTLEDMLNKKYSQDNSESSKKDGSSNASATKDSKEDKFLNSLINDDKDSSENKINLFASRTAAIQNQGANAVTRGLTINKVTFADDLIKNVKFMSSNSLKELTVKVNPGNLGEITIRLVQEDGLMKANLKANSKETSELLSQNLADIKKQLSEQNIKVSEVNIEIYQDDTTFFKGKNFEGQFADEQNNKNSNSQNTASVVQGVADEELDDNLAQENSNVNFLA